MAQLTPLSKGLLGLIIVGGMVSVAWNLVLKERVAQLFPGGFTGGPIQATPEAAPPSISTVPASSQGPASARSSAPVPVQPAPAAVVAPILSPSSNKGMTTEQLAEEGRRLAAEKDYVRARPYLEDAVKQGSASAACMLGDMTMKGLGGLKPNSQRAGELFQTAQARGVLCFGQ